MTPEQFCYWLQGFAELSPHAPNQMQWNAVREHLATVFNKVTPPVQPELKVVGPAVAGWTPEQLQEELKKHALGKPVDAWPPRVYMPNERKLDETKIIC